jgi:hypothetical protein
MAPKLTPIRMALSRMQKHNGLMVAKLLLAVRCLYSLTVALIGIENVFGFVLLLVCE